MTSLGVKTQKVVVSWFPNPTMWGDRGVWVIQSKEANSFLPPYLCVGGGNMGLTRCRECGKKVSDEATFCPHCGCPNPATRPPEVDVVEVPAWEAPEKYGGRFKAFFITIWEGILYPRKFYRKVINSENRRPAWIFFFLLFFTIGTLISYIYSSSNPFYKMLSSPEKIGHILGSMIASLIISLPYVLLFAYFLSTFRRISFNKCLRFLLYWEALTIAGVLVTCGLFYLISPFHLLIAFCNIFDIKYTKGCLLLIAFHILATFCSIIIAAIISLPIILLSSPY
jgi:hypothetical protein